MRDRYGVFRFTAIVAVTAAIALVVLAILVNTTRLGEIQWLRYLLGKSALNFTIRAAIPLTLGALCGILCERSGVINIGIEGMMLAGAFAAFVVKVATNNLPLGLSLALATVAALLVGGLMALFHAGLCIRFKVDQIISGTVIIILSLGLTTYLFDPDVSASGKYPAIAIPLLAKIPLLGDVLFNNAPITYIAITLVIFINFMLFRNRWGLRTRAVGEHPRAADTVGINVNRTRYINVVIGGMIAGLAGAFLTLEAVGTFEKLMSNGRGFIALAAMIFGKWTPIGSLGAALLFGFAEALSVQLQIWGVDIVPYQFLSMLPYVLTIIVLAGVVGRANPPAAVGLPYEKE